ncbi:hypothetical protein [Streptomyces sp. NPDC051079]|uniref:hypothetical protein n=1 Tax=Streptomyces sp. NPDC051079 TaxID=3155043 RepID=UPI00344ECF88
MHHSHVVDGIPVFRISQHGALEATLCFGVGVRDEKYATFGISHRIAQLTAHALHRQRPELPKPVVKSGFEETRFMVTGSPDEVSEGLELLCRSLSDLPGAVLGEAVTATGEGYGQWFDEGAASALNARYGSQGAGLAGHEEIREGVPDDESSSHSLLPGSAAPTPS